MDGFNTQEGAFTSESSRYGGGPSQPQNTQEGAFTSESTIGHGGGPSQPQVRNESLTHEWVIEQHRAQQVLNAQILETLQRIQSKQEETGGATPASTETPPLDTDRGVSGASRRVRHSQPHPSKYDGEDRSVYPSFKGQLRAKLRIDRLAIGPTEPELVWYAYGCLSGKAASRIYPWINAHERKSIPLRVNAFFEELDMAFYDTQTVQKALEWINMTKQKTTPFRDFLHDFEQKLLEAEGWEFSDVIRIGYLRAALSTELKRELVAQPTPSSYAEFVSMVRRTSDNLEEIKRIERVKRGYRSYAAPTPTPRDDKMDWETTSRVASGQTPSRTPAKWVTSEVLDQRRRDSACLRCGETTHFISKCKLGPARRPSPGRAEKKATRSTKKKGLPREEEASESEATENSDSGKE
jgi:hypothetical protein